MVKIHIGFTGTQEGMTEAQVASVNNLLGKLKPISIVHIHHGDCIGADAKMHELSVAKGCAIIIHPPENDSKRAFCTGAIFSHEPAPYLERNHDIVNDTKALIATPKSEKEELRSGTWATIRYARGAKKPIYIVYPDGKITNG